jgi:hypothetical protein
MPWKECSAMDDWLQFVARRLAGEPMAELCREFGISRKPATRSSIAIRNAAFRGSQTEAADFLAAFVSYTGFLSALVRFEFFVAFLDRSDFFFIFVPSMELAHHTRVYRQVKY